MRPSPPRRGTSYRRLAAMSAPRLVRQKAESANLPRGGGGEDLRRRGTTARCGEGVNRPIASVSRRDLRDISARSRPRPRCGEGVTRPIAAVSRRDLGDISQVFLGLLPLAAALAGGVGAGSAYGGCDEIFTRASRLLTAMLGLCMCGPS